MPYLSVSNPSPKPLIVRLRNFIGDVVLMIPALERLQDAGYELHCVGKGWAKSLLEGHGWPVTSYPKRFRERVATLRSIQEALVAAGKHRRDSPRSIDAITFATSFSSAMDMRFAGLRPFGYAVEGRSIFLKASARIVYGEHAMHSYWRLAGALLDQSTPPPTHVSLKLSESAKLAADRALSEAGVRDGFVVAVPFAGGTFEKLDKKWPHFAPFIEKLVSQTGRDVVLAPAPDEVELATRMFPSARLLTNLALGPYAAVLQRAALTVSNDTGPGHMAAAVGGRLLSVLGPTKAEQWGALGPGVTILQDLPPRDGVWPEPERVLLAAKALLSAYNSRP